MTDENALDDWGILCFVWLIRLVSIERNWMLNWVSRIVCTEWFIEMFEYIVTFIVL